MRGERKTRHPQNKDAEEAKTPLLSSRQSSSRELDRDAAESARAKTEQKGKKEKKSLFSRLFKAKAIRSSAKKKLPIATLLENKDAADLIAGKVTFINLVGRDKVTGTMAPGLGKTGEPYDNRVKLTFENPEDARVFCVSLVETNIHGDFFLSDDDHIDEDGEYKGEGIGILSDDKRVKFMTNKYDLENLKTGTNTLVLRRDTWEGLMPYPYPSSKMQMRPAELTYLVGDKKINAKVIRGGAGAIQLLFDKENDAEVFSDALSKMPKDFEKAGVDKKAKANYYSKQLLKSTKGPNRGTWVIRITLEQFKDLHTNYIYEPKPAVEDKKRLSGGH